ncbi:hypothetical protein QUV93_01820 [Phascolarctobacterium faecium]|nr:hypothetical protein [Phascolarctobacterium faecium]MDM8108607.1 hypothetical protein [Phascolarctobacterium faecium]
MYRLLIIADDGKQRKMLTIGGERKSIEKDMLEFFDNERNLEWQHSKNERLAMALFKGIIARHVNEAEQEE